MNAPDTVAMATTVISEIKAGNAGDIGKFPAGNILEDHVALIAGK